MIGMPATKCVGQPGGGTGSYLWQRFKLNSNRRLPEIKVSMIFYGTMSLLDQWSVLRGLDVAHSESGKTHP